MNQLKETILVCLVGLVVAAIAFFLTAPQVSPFLSEPLSPMLQVIAVGGSGIVASLLFGLYRHWMNSFFKVRLFLAPLAGCLFAAIAYYLTDTGDSHWTIYSIVNLVEPSLAVQKAFTLLGFAAGAVLMLFLGSVFFKPRFFVSFVLGNAAFAACGWALSVKVLPYLAQAQWSFDLSTKLSTAISSFGLSIAIFVSAFVFFVTLLPGQKGTEEKQQP